MGRSEVGKKQVMESSGDLERELAMAEICVFSYPPSSLRRG